QMPGTNDRQGCLADHVDVVINVHGGVVQAVFGSNELRIAMVDWDNEYGPLDQKPNGDYVVWVPTNDGDEAPAWVRLSSPDADIPRCQDTDCGRAVLTYVEQVR
ncbi:MAG TPA: hypothetical protein VFS30_00325, partial [Dehalococcoidia bacterium]|nr:hypothetical protein [Dehalococcoidia bacterium]